MIELDGTTAIGASLETHFGLEKYLRIIRTVQADGFAADADFREDFNGYFRVRQRPARWYDRYYELMAEQKRDAKSFPELLRCMAEIGGWVEASFVSKLMAAVQPELPIWDQYVLQNTGQSEKWRRQDGKSREERIECAGKIYENIKKEYALFLDSDRGRACIALFDELLPGYKHQLTDVKKLDYLLWSKR